MFIRGNIRFVFIILPVVTGIYLFIACADNKIKKKIPGYADFADSRACESCHSDIYKKHLGTAHFNSSMPASAQTIKGSFDSGLNSFYYDMFSKVMMEKRKDSFYQVYYIATAEKYKSKFDIVVGSGKKGQSFLSWKQQRLIQMLITYFKPEHAWSVSPGFSPVTVAFNRVVTSRCLECHSTYFHKTSDDTKHPEEYDRDKIIYAIGCEKCHGPGKEHIRFHKENPVVKEGKFIINPSKLSRQQNIDLCALCHSGKLEKTKPPFSFTVGDTLGGFFKTDIIQLPAENIDVHGNQLGALKASKCFLNSSMTCQSCHNVHENESTQLEMFSSRCINCHTKKKVKDCPLKKQTGDVINKNCIDCHMPLQPSQSIAVFLQGQEVPTPAKLRTHFVKIYKEETDKVIAYMKTINKPGK